MTNPEPSPKILAISWGSMEVEDLGTGRDFMLHPGGGKAWDWRESGTHHRPGILPEDVRFLIEHGARTVVLSQGMELKLGIAPETFALLESLNVPYRTAESREAVRIYNELAAEGPVGGLFHSTC